MLGWITKAKLFRWFWRQVFFFTDTKKNHVFHKHFVLWRGFHTPILFGEFFPYPVLSSQKDVSRVELFCRLFHQKLNQMNQMAPKKKKKKKVK